MHRWLHEHRTCEQGCTARAMDAAATYGHLAVVHWLREHRQEGRTPRAMDAAAMFGRHEVVRFHHM